MADSMNSPLALELPLSREALASLRAGDACTLSGAMYTLRDAGHMRLLDELHDAFRMIWKAPRFFMRGRHLLRQVDPLAQLALPRHRAWISLLLSCIGRALPPRWARECAAKL